MSIHRSLVTQGKLSKHRNVLRRSERLLTLLEEGRWKPEASPLGLPKVRSIRHKLKKGGPKKEAAAGAAAPAAGAAKPAEKAPAAKADKGAKK